MFALAREYLEKLNWIPSLAWKPRVQILPEWFSPLAQWAIGRVVGGMASTAKHIFCEKGGPYAAEEEKEMPGIDRFADGAFSSA